MATTVAQLDFIFEPPSKVDGGSLLQGDLLQRTPELARMVREAHRYYADATDYSHFLVLTQSCDLVRRKGVCKSRYITICAVRPLVLAVEREFERYIEPLDGFPLPVGKLEDSVLARQFLERVLNNTVDGIFFIPKGAAPSVREHLCAFLPLSIALRAEHYDTCLQSKVAQATEIFAAKIGHLTSGLYGRIATPDLSEKYGAKAAEQFRNEFFNELGIRSVAWLSTFQLKQLQERIAARLAEELAGGIDPRSAEALLRGLPNEVDALATRAVDVLIKKGLITNNPDAKRRARNFLVNDSAFSRIAKRG